MTYRDERDALRNRSEHLADELETARRELEAARAQVAAHESKDVDDERRIAELSERLAKLEGRPRPAGATRAKTSAAPVISVVAAVVVAAIGGAVFFVVSARRPAPQRTAPPVAPVTTNRPAVPTAAPARHVTFRAKVAKASGAPVAAGAACTLEADLAMRADGREVRDLVLSCGATRLYKRGENDGQTIISSSRWSFDEAASGGAGRHHYRVLFEDKGQRSSRLYQIFVDTHEKRARLWRDEPDRASIDLTIDEWSDDRAGEPLIPPAAR